jgi:UDP-N-acetylglucosamine 4,6-dehydratase
MQGHDEAMSAPFRTFDEPLPDLNGANILITGGTGSFGQAFMHTVLERFQPKRVVIFSRDELKQFELEKRYPVTQHPALRYFIGDVRDQDRLEMAMRNVDIVIHAAALKHVPIAEYNPFECVRTNVFGAENIVRAAIRSGVKRVVALSTDKAANPINLYGATKLASDKIFVSARNLVGAQDTRFAVVRYGNVVGSRGSVLPFFQRLIREGSDHLPITDERMTRFWITLRQGVNFVLSSLAMMRGGEIFVPRIPSMTITDLAEALAPALEQRIVGIRPGEKLHEVMIPEDDGRSTVELSDRFAILPADEEDLRQSYLSAGARPIDANFRYSSETNTEWLDHAGLQHLIQDTAFTQ